MTNAPQPVGNAVQLLRKTKSENGRAVRAALEAAGGARDDVQQMLVDGKLHHQAYELLQAACEIETAARWKRLEEFAGRSLPRGSLQLSATLSALQDKIERFEDKIREISVDLIPAADRLKPAHPTPTAAALSAVFADASGWHGDPQAALDAVEELSSAFNVKPVGLRGLLLALKGVEVSGVRGREFHHALITAISIVPPPTEEDIFGPSPSASATPVTGSVAPKSDKTVKASPPSTARCGG